MTTRCPGLYRPGLRARQLRFRSDRADRRPRERARRFDGVRRAGTPRASRRGRSRRRQQRRLRIAAVSTRCVATSARRRKRNRARRALRGRTRFPFAGGRHRRSGNRASSIGVSPTKALRLPAGAKFRIDASICGPEAARSLPRIAQIFVNAPADLTEDAFERALFRARRLATNALADDENFYVVTLSASTIGYKAMVLPGALRRFYPDLARPELATSAVVFHLRFSTNTTPQWRLAQPFRHLAHNGEINTIRANRTWLQARSGKLVSPLIDFSGLGALVAMEGSDSQSLDNALELLLIGGIALPTAMRILVPPAWSAREDIDADLAAFYEYYALHTEPWDGPAGLVMCDGRYAACALDRNGLRPARWALADDNHLIVASEAGIWDVPASRIVAKGRLGPGEMIAVDLAGHRLLHNADIDALNRGRAPFKQWLREGVTYLESHLIDPGLAAEPFPPATLARFQKLFGLTREERDTVLTSLAEFSVEATGSMGDDTPIAALSGVARPLFDYFRQGFAQVTNPPIDPLRETAVMSLVTQIGVEGNVFELSPENAKQVMLTSPILSQRKLRQLLALPQFAGEAQTFVDLYYADDEDLEAALRRMCARCGGCRPRGIAPDLPERSLSAAARRKTAGACVARDRRNPSGTPCCAPALRLQSHRRNRHRARSASLRVLHRLRRDGGLSVSRVSDLVRSRAKRRARSSGSRGARARPQLPARNPQGSSENPFEDGDLDRCGIPRRAAVRDRRTRSRDCRSLFYRNAGAHRRYALFRSRERAARARARRIRHEHDAGTGRFPEVRAWRRIPRLQPRCRRNAATRGANRRRARLPALRATRRPSRTRGAARSA